MAISIVCPLDGTQFGAVAWTIPSLGDAGAQAVGGHFHGSIATATCANGHTFALSIIVARTS